MTNKGNIIFHQISKKGSVNKIAGILPDISTLSMYSKIGHFWDFQDSTKSTLDVNQKIEIHAPSKGTVDLIQTVESQRPSKFNDWLALGNDKDQDIGFITDGNVSYHEIFTIVNFDNGHNFVNDSTFSGSNTLIGGSTFGSNDQRITGSSGTADLLTSWSVDTNGAIRIDNNAESSEDILPLDFSVIHAANYSGASNQTDTITFGYTATHSNRGWPGFANCLILTNAELTELERQELTDWLILKRKLSILPEEDSLDGDVAILVDWGQSNNYYGKLDTLSSDTLPATDSDVRYYQPSTGNLITADEDLIEYLDTTTGNDNKSGYHVEWGKKFHEAYGKEVVLVVAAHGGTGFSNGYWNPGQSHYNSLISYINAAKAAIELEGKTAYVAHISQSQGEVEEANPEAQSAWIGFYSSLRSAIDIINSKTPVTMLSPTHTWRTSGDYGQAGVSAIMKDYANNIMPFAYYIESQASWLTNADVFTIANGYGSDSTDSTHYAQKTHVNQIASGILTGHNAAKNRNAPSGSSVFPQTIYNLACVNESGTLNCYGFKTSEPLYLNPWFKTGVLKTYEWDIVVADDANRTNEVVLTTKQESTTTPDNNVTYTLPAKDNKYYYCILRGVHEWDGVDYTSEFVAQTKYFNEII